jgi:hypothetical protein
VGVLSVERAVISQGGVVVVLSAKRPQRRARRLGTLIGDSAAGRKIRELDGKRKKT